MCFVERIEEKLRFVVDGYGFQQTVISPHRVRYTSPDVTLEAIYSERGEIDLVVDEIPPSRRFQFRLYLKLYYPSVEQTLGYGIATTDDQIDLEVARLADTLKRFGKPVLRRDLDVFARIKTFVLTGE